MTRLHLILLTFVVRSLRKAFDRNPGKDSNLELGVDAIVNAIDDLTGLSGDISMEAMYRRSRLENITDRHSQVSK